MNANWRKIAIGALVVGNAMSAALGCGTPPVTSPPQQPPPPPPPPPPAPPIVCCVVIDHFVDPVNPNLECIITRYFRRDGAPLYESNPMPLAPGQLCACALPPLPSIAVQKGARIVSTTFGDPRIIPWQDLPPDQPPYGPFQPLDDPNLSFQVDSFFDIFVQAATPPPGTPGEPQNIAPPDTGRQQLWTFGAGPNGGQIPPGVFWDIYQKIRVPRGFDPNCLCVPGQIWFLGLFLIESDPTGAVRVVVEPSTPGPGLTPSQFAAAPDKSAFYKFRWYRPVIPPPCPPPCVGDANLDGIVSFTDVLTTLGQFNQICPQ